MTIEQQQKAVTPQEALKSLLSLTPYTISDETQAWLQLMQKYNDYRGFVSDVYEGLLSKEQEQDCKVDMKALDIFLQDFAEAARPLKDFLEAKLKESIYDNLTFEKHTI